MVVETVLSEILWARITRREVNVSVRKAVE